MANIINDEIKLKLDGVMKAMSSQLSVAMQNEGDKLAQGGITGDQTAAILNASKIKYDKVIPDKLFNDYKKNNPDNDQRNFLVEKGAGLDDGRYVIGSRLVEKRDGQVAFIV